MTFQQQKTTCCAQRTVLSNHPLTIYTSSVDELLARQLHREGVLPLTTRRQVGPCNARRSLFYQHQILPSEYDYASIEQFPV